MGVGAPLPVIFLPYAGQESCPPPSPIDSDHNYVKILRIVKIHLNAISQNIYLLLNLEIELNNFSLFLKTFLVHFLRSKKTLGGQKMVEGGKNIFHA